MHIKLSDPKPRTLQLLSYIILQTRSSPSPVYELLSPSTPVFGFLSLLLSFSFVFLSSGEKGQISLHWSWNAIFQSLPLSLVSLLLLMIKPSNQVSYPLLHRSYGSRLRVKRHTWGHYCYGRDNVLYETCVWLLWVLYHWSDKVRLHTWF